MDKNIKKIISEAFSELYEEFVNEAPAKGLKKTVISDGEIEGIIEKAKRTGRGFSFDQTETPSSQENFNIIVDNLLSFYKENPTENIKAKEAVQNAFAPIPGTKLSIILNKDLYGDREEVADAISEAYYSTMIKGFDSMMKSYKMDKGFSAMVLAAVRRRAMEFFTKRTKNDAYGTQGRTVSLDSPVGAGELRTLKDTEFTAEDGTVSTGRDILDRVMTWFDNHIGSDEFPVNEKHYIAFKGIVEGDSPQQIFDENPGVFGKPKDVNIYFDRFINSKPAQEISDLVSNIYSIDFNLANLDKFGLTQTSAQSPEWSSFSKVDEKFTEEMKAIQSELFDSLKSLGFEPKDFNSDKKIEAIISALGERGMESEASVIESLFDDLERAKSQAKSKGMYGAKTTPLPKSEKEEEMADEYGGMFEGIPEQDIDKLMERVLKRLSK